MKTSLAKDLRHYAKTKGRAPLDERQMNTLKDLYVELAKSSILGTMIFIIFYGYMDLRGMESTFDFLDLSISFLGVVTYYYLLRFCYQRVIGFDSNFEVLVIPSLVFTPFLLMNALHVIGYMLHLAKGYFMITSVLWPLYFLLIYAGANRVYQNGLQAQEYQMEHGEQHFRSRKQIVNYVIFAIAFLAILPIFPYDTLFQIGILAATIFTFYLIWHYGFHKPRNEYVLNDVGLVFYKALWNRKGGCIPYEEIETVEQRDTFNIGFCKDKVYIRCKNGKEIMLYPENSYQFCVELENNL